MFERIVTTIINDLGATGVLVVFIACVVRKHFISVGEILKKTNGKADHIILLGQQLIELEKKKLEIQLARDIQK